MKYPLISIVIPAYNSELFIENTINCWQKQNYERLEIIVQDDFSKDKSFEIASTLAKKDSRIKAYRNSGNYGIGKNWNEGFGNANGEFVIIFNADDLIPDNFIETLLPFLINDESLDFVSCDFKYWILKKNNEYYYEDTFNKLPEGKIENINLLLLAGYPFSHVFTIHRRKSLNKLLLSDGTLFILHQVCDFELWLRMGIGGFKGYHTNKIFGSYIKHLTNNSYIKNAEFSGTEEILKHHKELKNQSKKIYKDWLFINFYNHIKYSLRNLQIPHFKSLLLLLKYYFK